MESKINIEDLQKVLNDTQVEPRLSNLRWENKGDIKGRYILIAAPPKSGSTWTANVIKKSLQCRAARYCYAWSSNEHDIYVPALLANQGFCSVAQMHMKGTPHNVQLIVDFQINTILITRNIYDSLTSFARDLMAKKDLAPQAPGLVGYSFVWTKNFNEKWLFNDFLNYAIKYYLPWYVNFLSSWSEYKDSIAAQTFRYEAIRSNPKQRFKEMIHRLNKDYNLCDRYQEQFSFRGISATNSNTSSGLSILSLDQRNTIESYFDGIENDWIRSHLRVDI
ncbi:hypothetical protein FZX09_10865 [Synechococcus sp. MU1643]|uniref:sulfotransferase domain-containing protein n=1 Tax=Synechococcus sp. MU1643 TaxID=2508349 RepID=UPI001CF90AAC|nr:sulfotransferase domain-containing protein [Synechococcus sp. MU1643]MCB4429272.1 hypothetical protein [Synechococcus sp. MU1643]